MTDKLTYRLFLPALLLLAAAAANAAESRSVKDFQNIEFALPGQLTVLQGERTTLELDAAQDDLARIETTVQDDVLIIRWSSGWFGWFAAAPQGDVLVRVTVPRLHGIDLVGSGEVRAGSWSAEAFALAVNGSGSVHLEELQADELQIRVSGSGEVVIDSAELSALDLEITGSGGATLAGKAAAQDIRVQGSGVVAAAGLQAMTAAVSIMGSGVAEVWARQRLSAELQGSGRIRYRGEPELLQNVSGSGSISPLDRPQ